MSSRRARASSEVGTRLGWWCAALLCAGLLCAAASAQPPPQSPAPFTVTLSPAATSIHWTLGTTLHTVHGTFKLKSGSFEIDPAIGEASGLIVFDAASGESGDSARDNRMNKVVLETARYPEMSYRPTHVSGRIDLAAGGTVTVDGVFNLHGADHPLQLTVTLRPEGAAGARMATHFSVPFVAWGMKDPSTFILRTDKQVAVDVEASFVPMPEHTPARPVLRPGEVHTVQ
jgi:polyisoprenoid-binding protein YceI